jgi:flagellar basal-body rod modification protein FlgD
MAAAAGIWNHSTAAGSSLTGVNPMDTTSGTSTSSTSSATISANDFLTLLVTEMKNQDPTASTDPNEYINQLVQVNSLEQLIDINQTLTNDSSSTASSGSIQGTGQSASQIANPVGSSAATTAQTHAATHKASAAAAAKSALSGAAQALQPSGATTTNGNLSVPAASPAAQRVSQALSGRTHIGT